MKTKLFVLLGIVAFSGVACRTLFGWDIHAPGVLSADFQNQVAPMKQRMALYIPPEVAAYQSREKGGRLADPQTYHVGEALAPMLVEAFQQGFDEFILVETEPTPEILRQYAIPYLAVVALTDFGNRVTLKGQALAVQTETVVYDTGLNPVFHFEAQGVSDAEKVFAKKGGPQVNLNAAIERNLLAVIQQIQDSIGMNSPEAGKT